MFASKYVSVILMCAFRMHRGSGVKWASYKWQLVCAKGPCALAMEGVPSGCLSSQETLEVLSHLES